VQGLLIVDHIRKSYGDQLAVDGLSFVVEPGQVLGLLGPNGAGKTTTMSIIAGLLQPDEGQLLFQDKPVSRHSATFRKMLGVVPQELAIYPELTAEENLVFFGRLYGLRAPKLNDRVDWALDRVGLSSNAKRNANTFSGGMKRRLNFAAALLHEPQLLMLDEPTVGVDPQSRAHLLECVRELRDAGTAIIYASHYMEEVQTLCDRVLIIDHGRALASGTLDELLERVQTSLRIQISGGSEKLADGLSKLADVDKVRESENGSPETRIFQIDLKSRPQEKELGQTLNGILESITNDTANVLSIASHESNLERLFLELTGNTLRD
jgi:ABC-2 type transport system ATP-binding protein